MSDPRPRFSRKLMIPALQASALSLAHSGAWAQSAQTIENVEVVGKAAESYLTEEMSTATGLGLSGLETPQSVSAISRVQIDDFELDTLNDALQTTVGVQVESVETDRTYYTARGFDITNFQLDGVGVPATYGNTNGEIDTAIYERIEVVRGANGLMSGAGNPSATINMVRKRPTDELQLSLGAKAGSWGSRRLDADVSGTLASGLRGRLVAVSDQGDSYLDNYASDTSVVYGVLDKDLGEATRLTIGVSYQSSKADSPLWGALPLHYSDGSATDYDVSTSTAADWAYSDIVDTTAFAELKHTFANGWEAQAYYTHTEIDSDNELFYMYSLPDPDTEEGLIGYAGEYGLEESRDLLDIRVTGTYQLLGREQELMIGANWSEGNVEDLSLFDYSTGAGFPWIGDFTQWSGDTPRPVFADAPSGSDWSDEQSAVYAATRLHLTDGLSLIGGARVVDWKSEGTSYGESQDTEVNGKVLPYAGLVYRFLENYSVYASRTETFMPQSDLDRDLKHLVPAESISNEIGVKGAFMDGKFNASLALFRAEYNNVSESAGFNTDLGITIYEGHDYESEGYELELTGELAPGLQASFGYTDLNIEENGEDARSFVPGKVLRLYTSYRLPMLEQLKIGAGVNWQDDIHRTSAYGHIIEQESYATVSAFANYRFSENLNFALNANNLTDEKYINSLYWDQGYYAAPRNASVSVNWRY